MEKCRTFKDEPARCLAQNRLYDLAYEEPLVETLRESRVVGGSRHQQTTITTPQPSPTYYGLSELVPHDQYGLKIRRALTLRDRSGTTILQRFGPSRRYLHKEMLASIAKGRDLFDAVLKVCKVHHTADERATSVVRPGLMGGNGHYHFGVWYGQGCTHVTPSTDLKQDGKPETTKALAKFLVWLNMFVDKYVYPFVKMTAPSTEGERHVMSDNFRDAIVQRQPDYQWLCSEVPLATDLFHPLYNVCSPFTGFTRNVHADPGDSSPTVLLNFGYAHLHLPRFNAVVDLHPGEFVFFSADTVEHFTTPSIGSPADEDEHKRWGISCFFQRRIQTRMRPREYPSNIDLHRRVRQIINDRIFGRTIKRRTRRRRFRE